MSLSKPSAIGQTLDELDEILLRGISEVNVVLVDQSVKVTDIESAIRSFSVEMASRHVLTLFNVWQDCYPLFKRIMRATDLENVTEEYQFLSVAITGWAKGLAIGTEGAELKMRTASAHYRALNSIFSEEVFVSVQKALPGLIKDFLSSANVCATDIVTSSSAEDKDKVMLEEFAQALTVHKLGSTKLLEHASKPEIMQYYWKNKSQEIFGTPCERLFLAFNKLLLYWDILHHAGYFNMSKTSKAEWTKIF